MLAPGLIVCSRGGVPPAAEGQECTADGGNAHADPQGDPDERSATGGVSLETSRGEVLDVGPVFADPPGLLEHA
jgi:hypothetical protein